MMLQWTTLFNFLCPELARNLMPLPFSQFIINITLLILLVFIKLPSHKAISIFQHVKWNISGEYIISIPQWPKSTDVYILLYEPFFHNVLVFNTFNSISGQYQIQRPKLFYLCNTGPCFAIFYWTKHATMSYLTFKKMLMCNPISCPEIVE